MYLPESFRLNEQDIPRLIEQYPFATLVSVDTTGPIINFAPLLFDAKQHQLLGHLANSNQQLEVMLHHPAISVIFHGPDGYISPNWYQDKTQVPTWNFVTIEIKGTVTLIQEVEEKRQLLETLSNAHEQRIHSDWTISKVPEAKLNIMLNAITGFSIQISSWQGKAKLSQNKSTVERLNLIKGLESLTDLESQRLLQVMKKTV